MSRDRWWMQDTPIGAILVVVGDGGVRSIHFEATPLDAPLGADNATDSTVASALDNWFAAKRTTLTTIALDWSGIVGFRREVLQTLHRDVPWGETVTYGELAGLAGRPRAARAVGTSVANNPFPFVVPCHRVVASTGIGGYGGTDDRAARSVAIKRWLLEHETTVAAGASTRLF